ncbi:MAG: hypothetical protein RDV48_11700 [Candidatus Eremiobacteraeota bacterium]|nr:hypothetical protein [Candidatus Eremiobacteraeota bacterium]
MMFPVRRTIFLAALVLLLAASSLNASAVEKIRPDQRAVELIDRLLAALSIQDPDERLRAVIPLVHRSMLTEDGKDLDRDTKDFSYKKACQNVGFYRYPADIKEVHKGNVYTIGWKETAEKGRTDRYFIRKKPGASGVPAPLSVFLPENGGPPKIVDMGSL